MRHYHDANEGKTYRLSRTNDNDYFGLCDENPLAATGYYAQTFNVGITPGCLEWALSVLADHFNEVDRIESDYGNIEALECFNLHIAFTIEYVLPEIDAYQGEDEVVVEITTQEINDFLLEMNQRVTTSRLVIKLSERVQKERKRELVSARAKAHAEAVRKRRQGRSPE